MHDLLLLLSIIRGDYDVVISDIEEVVETTRQTERGEHRTTKARINKTNDSFLEERNCSSTSFLELRMRLWKDPKQNYFTENILEFLHKSLCGREQMHMESNLKMSKLQYTKEEN